MFSKLFCSHNKMYSRTPISRPALKSAPAIEFFGIVAIFAGSPLRFQFLQRIAEKKEETAKPNAANRYNRFGEERRKSRSRGCGWARRHRRWSHSFLTSCPNIDSTVCVTALLYGCMGVWMYVCVCCFLFMLRSLHLQQHFPRISVSHAALRCVFIAVCCRFLLCVILARNRQLFKQRLVNE